MIKKNGFTLVELLVVMVIVGLLVGLAVPALNDTLGKSRFAESQSNLRQIGIALALFAQDNNGILPVARGVMDFIESPGPTDPVSWAQQLDGFTGKNRKIFYSAYAKTYNGSASRWGYFLGSHAAGVDALAQGLDKYQAIQFNKITQPSRHILAGECHRAKNLQDADMDDYDSNNPAFGYSGRDRSVNILYADGHVESHKRFDPATMSVLYSGVDSSYTGYQ